MILLVLLVAGTCRTRRNEEEEDAHDDDEPADVGDAPAPARIIAHKEVCTGSACAAHLTVHISQGTAARSMRTHAGSHEFWQDCARVEQQRADGDAQDDAHDAGDGD